MAAMPTLCPYITVSDGEAAIAFYRDVLGAEETMRLAMPDGTLAHAEIRIGDAVVMLSEEHTEHNAITPGTLGGSPVTLVIEVDDVDARLAKAVGAGAQILRPASDEFHGNRMAKVRDPFGHLWFLKQTIEELSTAEIIDRFEKMVAG